MLSGHTKAVADTPEPAEDSADAPVVPEQPGSPGEFGAAGDRAAGRRDVAAQRVRELRARSFDYASTSDSAADAATALQSARLRADAAERSAVIAHESAALAHERAAHAHEVAAQATTGAERERHEARAVALRAHADRERLAVTPYDETPED
jgi:hypothetical protein